MASSLAGLLGLDTLIPQDRHERLLALSSLINTFGNGLFYTISALYFTRIVGLHVGQLGVGLSIASAFGVVAALSTGRLADIWGPRGLAVSTMALSGMAMFFLAFAHDFLTFVAGSVAVAMLERASNSARSVIISRIGGPDGRVRIRAYLRSVVNLGIAVGTLCAGVALAIDSPAIYRALIIFDAFTTLFAAFALSKLPTMPPLHGARETRSTTAIRDHRFIGLMLLNVISSMHYHVLEIAVPLWIASHTAAPRWTVAAVLLINTIACVLFQVRLSAGAETPLGAAAVARSGAIFLALGMAVYASAAAVDSPVIATLILLAASAVHVTGELRQAAASFGIGFGLPPENLQGQYQGVWSLGNTVAGMIAPIVLTTLCLTWGWPGWLLLGGLFILSGSAMLPLVRRAVLAQHSHTSAVQYG